MPVHEHEARYMDQQTVHKPEGCVFVTGEIPLDLRKVNPYQYVPGSYREIGRRPPRVLFTDGFGKPMVSLDKERKY